MKKFTLLLLLTALAPAGAFSQSPRSNEAAAARYFQSVRDQPAQLVAFLREMPKGGDLHNHLTGAVYAESFIEWAAAAGICIRTSDYVAVKAPCDAAAGRVPATDLLRDDDLRGHTIDAWSMRNWVPGKDSGHDHFFATFDKFALAETGRNRDKLTEVVRRAAAGRVSYLELMETPNDGAIALGSRVPWNDDFARMREALRAAGHDAVVTAARADYAAMRAGQRELMHCGSSSAEPGCSVEVRFLYQVLRGFSPAQVFAQILTGFAAAASDSLVVGLNLVMPEDGYISMRDYSLHMRMIDYLHGIYPSVKISLHAGELAPGLVPPEGLRFHIREAMEKGHASRIGHGVDVMHEDDAVGLLKEMARRHVAVEICLTSNDGILGVRGSSHPLHAYQMAGVATMLATDDEGVNRSEMTLEYLRAVVDQGLSYVRLKEMARNSLEHSFVDASTQARLLGSLERDFSAFEKKWGR